MPLKRRNGRGLEFHPVTSDRWTDFERLFGERGACGGCWCMLWRLKRSEFERQKGRANKESMRRLIVSGEIPGAWPTPRKNPSGGVPSRRAKAIQCLSGRGCSRGSTISRCGPWPACSSRRSTGTRGSVCNSCGPLLRMSKNRAGRLSKGIRSNRGATTCPMSSHGQVWSRLSSRRGSLNARAGRQRDPSCGLRLRSRERTRAARLPANVPGHRLLPNRAPSGLFQSAIGQQYGGTDG